MGTETQPTAAQCDYSTSAVVYVIIGFIAGRASDFVTSDNVVFKLRTLAALAASVGFDWVKYPTVGSYIHGSVISEGNYVLYKWSAVIFLCML